MIAWFVLALSLLVPEPIHLTVSPRIGLAPSAMHLKIIIERDVRNRALAIVVAGEHFEYSSVKPVDGDQSQRVWDLWLQDLPCGRYWVRVAIVRTDGEHPARGESEIRGPQCQDLEAQL